MKLKLVLSANAAQYLVTISSTSIGFLQFIYKTYVCLLSVHIYNVQGEFIMTPLTSSVCSTK